MNNATQPRPIRKCALAECKAPDEDCHEGEASADDCPHYSASLLDEGDDDEGDEVPGPPPKLNEVLLPPGTSLQPEDSLRITCARPTTLVIVAGAAASGKTTLIASLYERFLQGPIAGYSFAGSATLRGFERISHLGRTVSGLETPQTERTLRGDGRQLLHVRLRRDGAYCRDLLLSDLSGEEFDAARDSAEEARRLDVVRSAQRILLLVDGGKLVRLDARQLAREEATTLLRTFVEEGLVSPRTGVDVVFTKWDLVRDGNERRSKAFADTIWEDISNRYAGKVADLRKFKVIARHPAGAVAPGHGLEAAVDGWIKFRPEPKLPPIPSRDQLRVEYDRFLTRPRTNLR